MTRTSSYHLARQAQLARTMRLRLTQTPEQREAARRQEEAEIRWQHHLHQLDLEAQREALYQEWLVGLRRINQQAEERRHHRRERRLAQQPVIVDPEFTILRSGRKVRRMH
ncbi:hypothetical protein PHLCEN_2v7422 [Hermanssonia centrifuga]|uniref:Uncharacterized protein n=1 Tax=Hermanssonia centrifuga TaxID=98765 RepID=A0A2R6NWM3_9APHY|nr:hypothetical protein PHLCEN_2v7422 [Hermanssonia centrifuga]